MNELHTSVGETEAEVLDDPSLTLVHVQHALRRFTAALPPVAAVAEAAAERGLCGGALLDALHRGAQSGDPLLAGAFGGLFWHVQQPFYAQVTSWAAYADLSGGAVRRGEFFIARSGRSFGGGAEGGAGPAAASGRTGRRGGCRNSGRCRHAPREHRRQRRAVGRSRQRMMTGDDQWPNPAA